MTTFAALDKSAPPAGDSPLEQWYAGVRSKPIANLGAGDLAVALRQKIHVAHVVPRVLEVLARDAWAGEKYAGELLAALAQAEIPKAHQQRAREIATKALAQKPGVIASDAIWEMRRAEIAPLLATARSVRGVRGLPARTWSLPRDGLFGIGSGPHCELQVEGLARVHAKFRIDGERIDVLAIGPGVSKNGERFTGVVPFAPGDRLTLGEGVELELV